MRVLLVGGKGRLGGEILSILVEESIDHVTLDRIDLPNAGKLFAAETTPYVLVDVSLPAGALAWAGALGSSSREAKALCGGYLVGATGFSKSEEETLERALNAVPWALVSNFSAGVHLFTELLSARTSNGLTVAALARSLGFDLALWESHHTDKLDAPSGTAKALSKAAGISDDRIVATRVGAVVGEHILFAAADSEELRIQHIAHTRRLFARGAVEMAKRLFNNPQEPRRLTKGEILSLPASAELRQG